MGRGELRRRATVVLIVAVTAISVSVGLATARSGAPIPLERIAVPAAAAKSAAPSIWDFAEEPDGGVLAAIIDPAHSAGDFLVARLNSDGSLDTSFGEAGFTAPLKRSEGDQAEGIALEPGGGFVLVGSHEGELHPSPIVARFDAGGRLDPSFGKNGVLGATRRGGRKRSDEALHGVAITSGGRIVTVGATRELSPGTSHPYFGPPAGVVTAYRADGGVARSFGHDGSVYFPPTKATKGGDGYTGLRSIMIQPDGKIVVAGFERSDLFVARLLPDGRLDRHFGRHGKVVVKIDEPHFSCGGTCPRATPIASRPDGDLLVLHSDSEEAPALVRLLPDGRPDPRFGRHGIRRLKSRHEFLPFDMAISGGRIFLVGWEEFPTPKVEFAWSVHRYLLDGAVDPKFGRAGVDRRVIGNASAAFAALIRPGGQVWVGGSQSGTSPNKLLLGRYPRP